jgi:hypothetical protein
MSRRRQTDWALWALLLVWPCLTQCGRAPLISRPAPPAKVAAPDAAGGGGEITGLPCFECHTALSDQSGKIRFEHKAHAAYGAHCNVCHGPQDHAQPPAGAAPHTFGVAKACKLCHDGQRAPDTCRTCHTDTEKIKPTSHRRADFDRTHGREQATLDCSNCHQREWCARCHGLQLPHPAGWAASHAAAAKAQPKVCGQCHEPARCLECHNGLPMPHPATFLAVHGRSDQRLCAKCHQADFCRRCHDSRSPHPSDWPSTHGQQRAAMNCAACHAKDFCAGCHGLTMPHPANWSSAHGAAARRQPAVCARCHQTSTCAGCHGLPMPHPAGWAVGHGQAATQDRVICGRCHAQTFCRDCHGLEMPHPAGFVTAHGAVGSFDAKGVCLKCHQGKFCRQCHQQP